VSGRAKAGNNETRKNQEKKGRSGMNSTGLLAGLHLRLG
jgi:hypothetical protein